MNEYVQGQLTAREAAALAASAEASDVPACLTAVAELLGQVAANGAVVSAELARPVGRVLLRLACQDAGRSPHA